MLLPLPLRSEFAVHPSPLSNDKLMVEPSLLPIPTRTRGNFRDPSS